MVVLLFAIVFPIGASLAADPRSLQAEPFADPDHLLTMPDAWLKSGITHDEAVKDADLVVNLDQSEYLIFDPVIKEWAKEKNLNVFVNSGTCGVSNRGLLQKSIDVASFCCPPGDEDRLPGIRFHTVGVTPLALIVHPENPVSSVTLAEAQKLFTGEIQHWAGLKDGEGRVADDQIVQPISFIHCKKRPGHWRLLLDNEDLFSVRSVNVVSIEEMVAHVVRNNRAIGWEIPWFALKYHKGIGDVKILNLDGMDPLNLDFLAQGAYPLYRTFNLTTWTDSAAKNDKADELVRYLVDYTEKQGAEYWIVPSSRLKKAGWKFRESELVGMPQ